VKLVVEEPESQVLEDACQDQSLFASTLALTEVPRALARRDQAALWGPDWASLQEVLRFVELDRSLLVRAGVLLPTSLRSLDAVHLATALMLPGLEAFVGYDTRLQAAAAAAGLTALSPGVPA